MTGARDQQPALDSDQAAVLGRLVAAFGAEQVTVTAVQPRERPDPDPARHAAPAWQAALCEEASCTSTCS